MIKQVRVVRSDATKRGGYYTGSYIVEFQWGVVTFTRSINRKDIRYDLILKYFEDWGRRCYDEFYDEE